ncbi:hypothetical protein [Microbacterium testaceum]|uniref:hypothetical protein n=1 Tax=Microbacterium testaceum TaxID=2033 RepID=UPI0012473E0D|nr:hypothetical protein [Microbacterium testaceum]
MSDKQSRLEHVEQSLTTPAEIAADRNKLSPWAAIVGPCYTVLSFSRALKATPAAILEATAAIRVLRLPTADGSAVFPAFQVRGGQVAPDLQSVLKVLRGGIDDPWTWAQWLNTPRLNGVIQIDELWAGNVAEVMRDAGHDAWVWRS